MEKNKSKYHKNLHKRGKKLPHLYEKFNGKCVWCNQSTVLVSAIVSTKIEVGWKKVRWVDEEGNWQNGRTATVEHLVPIEKGGRNNIENLALACAECNNMRNRTTPLNPYGICKKCKIECKRNKRCCRKCAIEGLIVKIKEGTVHPKMIEKCQAELKKFGYEI